MYHPVHKRKSKSIFLKVGCGGNVSLCALKLSDALSVQQQISSPTTYSEVTIILDQRHVFVSLIRTLPRYTHISSRDPARITASLSHHERNTFNNKYDQHKDSLGCVLVSSQVFDGTNVVQQGILYAMRNDESGQEERARTPRVQHKSRCRRPDGHTHASNGIFHLSLHFGEGLAESPELVVAVRVVAEEAVEKLEAIRACRLHQSQRAGKTLCVDRGPRKALRWQFRK